ncbi:MAG: hypothetical protein HYY02_00120 [Chloroflexi bacterium]|nr:hypothetical protein [Chloroflexota bacterium]
MVEGIVRTATVSVDGRIGRRLESELEEGALVQKANDFLDTLVDDFPDLERLVDGKISPSDLRRSSLLGSTTMLRVLAGVYYKLAHDLSDGEITEFFGKLSGVMKAPVQADGPWAATGVFAAGAYAPNARRQDLEKLVDVIVGWAKTPPAWLQDAA